MSAQETLGFFDMPWSQTENMRGAMDSKITNVGKEGQRVAVMSHIIMVPASLLMAKIESKGSFLGVKSSQDQTCDTRGSKIV